jgi:putative FmdB family regulatory protein
MLWKASQFFSKTPDMPNYDYLCEKCGKTFEAFQSMKDKAFDICPKELCAMKTWGKGKVKRQLGAGAGLIFKGSGFYITDYRSSGYKEAAKKETTSTSSEIKKPAASAEKSKPSKPKE